MHEVAAYIDVRAGELSVVDATNGAPTHEIINLNEAILDRIANKQRFYGIEVSPVPSAQELDFNKMTTRPLFTSITWLLDRNLRQTTLGHAPALKLAAVISKSTPVMSHLTCYHMTENQLNEILLQHNVNAVLALRGDLRSPEQSWQHAIEMVRAIRTIKPNTTIAVAGYPEVHTTAVCRESDLQFLKEKVDAGANFIVTNVCFSFEAIAEFIRSCRALGIRVPIVPGIFTPSTYPALVQMCSICKVKVPDVLLQQYRARQHDAGEFNKFAVSCTERLIEQLYHFEFETIYGVHFFTLNKYDALHDVLESIRSEK